MSRFMTAALISTLLLPLPAFGQSRRKPDADKMAAKGIELLLTRAEGDAKNQWPYEGVYRVGGEIPIGYRVGGTAIVGLAIAELGQRSTEEKTAIENGVGFILESLEDEKMRGGFKRGYDVRGWGQTYALIYFLALERLGLTPKAHAAEVGESITDLIALLENGEIEGAGGWNYSRRGDTADASVFMTAPTVQALIAASDAGHKVDEGVIKRALDAIDAARMMSGSYAYNRGRRSLEKVTDKKASFMDKLPGAIARAPVAEVTLLIAGRGSEKRLEKSLENFFKHQEELEKRRCKTGTHLRPYGVAPYYYMYGHYYAAQAIEFVKSESKKKKFRKKLLKILSGIREEDGGFNDRVFERSKAYGTALAVMALKMPSLAQPKIRTTQDERKKKL